MTQPRRFSRFLLFIAVSVSGSGVFSAYGQGSLTPPGAPAPTMKTLDQVEARTALPRPSDYVNGSLTYPIVLSASGSYYLTSNLTVDSGDAIQIPAANVTLDLNGFTIATTASSPSGTAVFITGARVTVCNGFIYGSGTVSGTTYSGGGFTIGVNARDSANAFAVRDLTVTGCSSTGIRFAGKSLAQRCIVGNTGGSGIIATVVQACVAYNSGATAINCQEASDSSGISADTGISAINATNCWGDGGTGLGLAATNIARGCTGKSDSSIGLYALNASTCRGTSLSGDGLYAEVGTDCTGTTFSGQYGVHGSLLTGCRGTTSSGGYGISGDVLTNCIGTNSSSGYGVYADKIATNCYGTSSTGTGLRTATAMGCFGQSSSGNASAPGLWATTATNCRGYQTTGAGTAVLADNAITCTTQGGTIVVNVFKGLGTP